MFSDAVEYTVNAHCPDALVCTSLCDKIIPGMINAAQRLNIPVIFVGGEPMETGKTKLSEVKLDPVDAVLITAHDSETDHEAAEYERR
jgi:dihydroxy-acid dehydratase